MDSGLHSVIQDKIQNKLPSADFSLEDSDEDVISDTLPTEGTSASELKVPGPPTEQPTLLDSQEPETPATDQDNGREEEENRDGWDEFRSSFDALNVDDVRTVRELDEKQIRALKQELIASLMTMYHDSLGNSSSVAPTHEEHSDVVKQPDQSHKGMDHGNNTTDSTSLSFDKLDTLEAEIDKLLEDEEYFSLLKSQYSSLSNTTPDNQSYSSLSVSNELMKQLVSRHFSEVGKFQLKGPENESNTGKMSKDCTRLQETLGTSHNSTLNLDLRQSAGQFGPPKAPTVSSAAARIFQDRFAPPEDNSENDDKKEDSFKWQVVRNRKMKSQVSVDVVTPNTAGDSGSSVVKEVGGVQIGKMPVPRKHKKKPKKPAQHKDTPDTTSKNKEMTTSAKDDEVIATTKDVESLQSHPLQETAKSKKKKRRRNTSVSSDEGSQNSDASTDSTGIHSPNVSSNNRKSKKKPHKLKIKPTSQEKAKKNTVQVDTASVSSTSSDSDGQKSGRASRLKSFTPPVMGPNDDPIFGLYSLTEAEREEKIKTSLLRQIDGRKSIYSAPGTPTVIHIEETFSPPLLGSHPHTPPIAALYIPLDPDGLVNLSNAGLPKDVHEALHTALLTWLLLGFATGSLNISTLGTAQGRPRYDSFSEFDFESIIIGGESDPPQCEDVQIGVTSIVQTVDKGRSLIVCGITGSDVTDAVKFSISTLAQLRAVTFSHIFSTLGLKNTLKDICTQVGNNSVEYLIPFGDKVVVMDDCSILAKPVAFHWYCPLKLGKPSALQSVQPMQTTVVTLQPSALKRCNFVFDMLMHIRKETLNMSGFRTVYVPSSEQLVLALALRGKGALMKWLDIAGPSDPSLAAVTDPDSLNAKYGVSGQELFGYVRTPFHADASLAKWFGGRCNIQERTIEGITDPQTKSERRKRQKVRFSDESYGESPVTPEGDLAMPSPLYTLQVFPVQEAVLAISPFVPNTHYSCILREISRYGYGIIDVRRIRISYKRALSLSIPPTHIDHFAIRSNPVSDSPSSPLVSTTPHLINGLPPPPTLLLTLQRENGERFIKCLVDAVVHVLQCSTSFPKPLLGMNTQNLIFWCSQLDMVTSVFGDTPQSPTKPLFGTSSFMPQSATPSNHELDLVFLGVTTAQSLDVVAHLLDVLLLDDFVELEDRGAFELLGLKWVHGISRYQAKLLVEYCSSDSVLTVDHLTNAPLCAITCRVASGHRRLEELKPTLTVPDMDLHPKEMSTDMKIFHSNSSQSAFSCFCLFFTDKELFLDPVKYPMLPYLPPPNVQPHPGVLTGFNQPKPLLTCILSVALSSYNLFLKVFDKLCRNNFSLVGAKVATAAEDKMSPKNIVLALQKENCIWCLEQDMKPFVKSSESYKSALYWSNSFEEAIKDVQFHFPNGLCCDSAATQYFPQEYKALCPFVSEFPHLSKCISQFSDKPTLLQTTCLVLRKEAMQDLAIVSCLLGGLHSLQFELLDLHLLNISKGKALGLSRVFSKTGNNSLSDSLCGSCLTLVLRRSNAASCFTSLLQSCSEKMFQENVTYICAPDSEQQVHKVVNILDEGCYSEE